MHMQYKQNTIHKTGYTPHQKPNHNYLLLTDTHTAHVAMSTHDSDQMTIVASTQPHNQLDNLHNDVVDGNVDEFDKEPNEPHDEKAYCRGKGNSLKLCKEKQQTELNVRSVISTLSIRSEGCQKSAHISRDTDFA